MADSPQDNEKKITKLLEQWADKAASVKFYEMTLAEYTAGVQPSLDKRALIRDKEEELRALLNERDDADEVSLELTANVVKAIRGDKKFGEDSSLYEALGYVRQSERKTGLTRKKKAPPGETPKG